MSKWELTVFLLSVFFFSFQNSFSSIQLVSGVFFPSAQHLAMSFPALSIAPPRRLLLPRQLDQENGQINGPRLLGKPGPCEADIGAAKAVSEKSSLPARTAQNME